MTIHIIYTYLFYHPEKTGDNFLSDRTRLSLLTPQLLTPGNKRHAQTVSFKNMCILTPSLSCDVWYKIQCHHTGQ